MDRDVYSSLKTICLSPSATQPSHEGEGAEGGGSSLDNERNLLVDLLSESPMCRNEPKNLRFRRSYRFLTCSTKMVRLTCSNDGSHPKKYAVFSCGLRVCDRCDGKTKARLRGRYLPRFIPWNNQIRHLVLTYGYVNPVNGYVLQRLFKIARDFVKELSVDGKTRAFKGGICVLEIIDKGFMGWYVHYHFLTVGGYVSQAMISNEWERVSGRPVTFIRYVWRPRLKLSLSYVLKFVNYASKGSDVKDAHRQIMFQKALWKKHMVVAFGVIHGRTVDQKRVRHVGCVICDAVMVFDGFEPMILDKNGDG